MLQSAKTYPVPANELSRERLLQELDLKKRSEDPFFEEVVSLASEIFDAPIAFISLISGDTQSFLRLDGAPATETPRTHSMCAFTVAERRTIVSGDTHNDPRFRNHPIVTDPPHIRFSASAPIILSSGFCTGTICAVDVKPHEQPTDAQIARLERLARMVARFFEVPLEPDLEHVKRLAEISKDAQNEFLTLVSHELRTPLNGIVGIAGLLEPADEDEAELVQVLIGAAEHLNAIVENVLNFTELASGDIQLNERDFAPLPMLDSILSGQRRLAQVQGKSIDAIKMPDAALTLRGDPAKLELALVCLISNFVAHGGQRAHIELGNNPDGAIFISLSDDGDGIEAEQETRIWQPFSVSSNVTTRKADGLGLGLPLTRRIVELHSGTLELYTDKTGLKAQITMPAWRVKIKQLDKGS